MADVLDAVRRRLLGEDAVPEEPTRDPSLDVVRSILLKDPKFVLKEAENPPATPREVNAGKQRGYPMQAVTSLPLLGPVLQSLPSEASATSEAQGGTLPEKMERRYYANRRADESFAKENPVGSALAQLVGSGIGYGGIAKAFPTAMGMVGPTVASRAWPAAITGGPLSLADAWARGDIKDWGDIALAGGAGAGGGALGPLLSGAASGGVSAVANRVGATRPPLLKMLTSGGVGRMLEGIAGETPLTIAANRKVMGPAGIAGDLPGMTKIASGISNAEGPGSTEIRKIYQDRIDEAPQRIEAALNTSMGKYANVLEQKQYWSEEQQRLASPLYKQWESMSVHPTKVLKDMIPDLHKEGFLDYAETSARRQGIPFGKDFFTIGPQKNYPTTRDWDLIKRSMDSKIDQLYVNGDKKGASDVIAMRNRMMDEIRKTPAGKVWDEARSKWADFESLKEQVERGMDMFLGHRSGLTPEEMREELKHLSMPEKLARIQGARAAAKNAMGESVTADTKFRNTILAPNNQEKLIDLLGKKEGEALIKSMKAEKEIFEKTPWIIPNPNTGASAPARAANVASMFPAPIGANWHLNIRDFMGHHGPLPAIEAHRGIRTAKQFPEMVKLLATPEGPQMDNLVAQLVQEQNRRNRVTNVMSGPRNALSLMISGPGQFGVRQENERRKKQSAE